VTQQGQAPRDFTYITPRRNRLSEYEAVTCFTQADPDVMDAPGWFLLTAEGRPPWLRNSTRLQHPCWFDFRDPAALWQRTYVRLQAEQERSIEMLVEDAAAAGTFKDFDRTWVREILGRHYRVWTYFEYGVFRCFAQAQREALSDTLGNVFCFEAVDRMRHAQGVVIYLMNLEDEIEGFQDKSFKEVWLQDPAYQPARGMTERLMAVNDWGELAIATNLVIDPIYSELGLGQLIRRCAPNHGDPVTPLIIMTVERDRRRNQNWTQELVRMVLAPGINGHDDNRRLIQNWLNVWTPIAIDAAKALAPIYGTIPSPAASWDECLRLAISNQARIIGELELDPARNGIDGN
jgi:hypothetical protein